MRSHDQIGLLLIVGVMLGVMLGVASLAEAANPSWRCRLAAARARRCCGDQANVPLMPCRNSRQPACGPQIIRSAETAALMLIEQSAQTASETPVEAPQVTAIMSVEEKSVVSPALEWITKHQLPDGSWSFDHSIGPGMQRSSPNPGTLKEARNAATALALLPFLAAGQTHQEGEYQEIVRKGLAYLTSHLQPKEVGGSFEEPRGSMYSHGLATIALCEAYGMTADKDLAKPAQTAIDYIVWAQDPVGGGWRYAARQPGDTSVFGWQLSALKSAQLAGLRVPEKTMVKAMEFLDTVGDDDGAYSGYTGPGRGVATTAIGLLCRMEMGWGDADALQRGIEFLADRGPSLKNANMYYNFYATQAMFYYAQRKGNDGEAWQKWNKALRDYLIDEQATEGPAAGSWYFQHSWSDSAGRLYDTSLATLSLQLYYRHLPLWRDGPGG